MAEFLHIFILGLGPAQFAVDGLRVREFSANDALCPVLLGAVLKLGCDVSYQNAHYGAGVEVQRYTHTLKF